MSRDPYDSFVNQWLYSYWDYSECQNGNLCTHPFCPDHEVRDFWDKNDWPPMMTEQGWSANL
jgi:hypothetical protein